MARHTAKIVATFAAFGVSASAYAQQFENLDRLDSIVAMSVGANIGEPGGAVAPVDRRLKLAACPQVPQMSGMMYGAAMIECKHLGWRIRVPLNPGGQQQPMATMQPTAYGRMALVQKQVVVKKGDPVQLIAGGSAFMVTRMMVADEDGAPGDMIRVREDKKSDPVMARVQESGVVRAPDRF